MKHLVKVLCVLGCLMGAACDTKPPADVQSSLSTSPDFHVANPTDIAVLPVEDSTPDRRAAPHLDTIRSELVLALVRQRYSPLAVRAVDGQFAAEAASIKKAGVTAPASLQRVAGKFGEDAVLGVRVDSWDESSLSVDNELRFSSDVALLDSKSKKMLWSGHLNGRVKAGGFGPAPLDPEEKARSAAREFAAALIERMPRRMH
jgi:hypothetical protein